MTTHNHNTELEEILKVIFATHEMSGAWLDAIKDIEKVMNTYCYEQTLELINECFENNTGYIDDKLRKAAAERWGQE